MEISGGTFFLPRPTTNLRVRPVYLHLVTCGSWPLEASATGGAQKRNRTLVRDATSPQRKAAEEGEGLTGWQTSTCRVVCNFPTGHVYPFHSISNFQDSDSHGEASHRRRHLSPMLRSAYHGA